MRGEQKEVLELDCTLTAVPVDGLGLGAVPPYTDYCLNHGLEYRPLAFHHDVTWVWPGAKHGCSLPGGPQGGRERESGREKERDLLSDRPPDLSVHIHQCFSV